jgi:predicted transcriptional regulator
MVRGEERTISRNIGALLIGVRFKKKTCMRRSELEINLETLKILAQKGPLKLTHIMNKVNLNYDILKKNLGFLMRRGLIEERNVGRQSAIYSITRQGLTLLKGWNEVKLLLSVEKNDDGWQPFFRNSVSVSA